MWETWVAGCPWSLPGGPVILPNINVEVITVSRYIAFLLLACYAGTGLAANDTMRCGGKIIKVGMTTEDVLKYCGQPTSKEVEEHAVRSGNRVTGTTQLNRWIYSRGSTGKPVAFEFDGEKLLYIRKLDK
jgi:hypothetical protein